MPILDCQQDNSTNKYESLSSSSLFYHGHLFCSVSTMLFNQKFRGHTVDVVSLRGRRKKMRGRQLAAELCVYECQKPACSSVWYCSFLSHNQNKVTIVEMVSFFFSHGFQRVIFFCMGKTELNSAPGAVIRLAWDWNSALPEDTHNVFLLKELTLILSWPSRCSSVLTQYISTNTRPHSDIPHTNYHLNIALNYAK